MKKINLRLEFRITNGSILNSVVKLEGVDVRLWQTDKKNNLRFREFEAYEVLDEKLDIEFGCEGKNGASASLSIITNNKQPVILNGVISEGFL